MIEKQCAIEIQDRALKAITELSQILTLTQKRCSADLRDQIKEGVGRSIGQIQIGILEVILVEYPELDDLK
jgi:hypothetical protein